MTTLSLKPGNFNYDSWNFSDWTTFLPQMLTDFVIMAPGGGFVNLEGISSFSFVRVSILQDLEGFTGSNLDDSTITAIHIGGNKDTAFLVLEDLSVNYKTWSDANGLGLTAYNPAAGKLPPAMRLLFESADKITGANVSEELVGFKGADTIKGAGGDDTLFGGADNDSLMGGAGRDDIYGQKGADRMFGGNGGDALVGQGGNDRLFGGAGNDTINGGTNKDWLVGGKGNDLLIGGAGVDTFVFGANAGRDKIRDFKIDTDKVKLTMANADVDRLIFSQIGEDTWALYSDGSAYVQIIFVGLDETALDNSADDIFMI